MVSIYLNIALKGNKSYRSPFVLSVTLSKSNTCLLQLSQDSSNRCLLLECVQISRLYLNSEVYSIRENSTWALKPLCPLCQAIDLIDINVDR